MLVSPDPALWLSILQYFLLAQNDSILQAFLEIGVNGSASDVFDPDPQFLFFLRVIFLCNLVGWRGQRSHVFLKWHQVGKTIHAVRVQTDFVSVTRWEEKKK